MIGLNDKGDPFWPVKNWPVKFGQLNLAIYFMQITLDPQNLTGHLVFTSFDTGGRLIQAPFTRCRYDLKTEPYHYG